MVTLARNAMATRFEIALHGDNPVALRAAGEEALDEIDRLENQISPYRPTSEIAHLNARAARGPVRVSPTIFSLLAHAQKLSHETGGAFDLTIAPLVRCWGFVNGLGRLPTDDEITDARSKIGMHLVQLDEKNSTVRFTREGVMLDLGAIGKGFAIERAAELLRDAGITSALIHGGTSTVYALGHPPDSDSWKVAIENPFEQTATDASTNQSAPALPAFSLRDEALSVSAIWGRSFQSEGKTLGHVLDPRTGQPVTTTLLAAVVLPSATETDALSTALLVTGSNETISRLRPNMRTLLLTESAGKMILNGTALSIQT